VNRRTFLRVLGSAAVGLALAPQVLVAPPTMQPYWSAQAAAAPGALTFEMLREAIERINAGAGRQHPMVMYTTPAVMQRYVSLARESGLIYDAEL
jgi:hypothetical protein